MRKEDREERERKRTGKNTHFIILKREAGFEN
jgi:hypothetical protein